MRFYGGGFRLYTESPREYQRQQQFIDEGQMLQRAWPKPTPAAQLQQ